MDHANCLIVLCGVLASTAACSGSPEGDASSTAPFGENASQQTDASVTPPSFDESTNPSATTPAAPSDCATGTTDVFVVSMEGDFYRFNPGKLQFTKIGPLSCLPPPSPGIPAQTPSSMAVDRAGNAWVYYGGRRQLFKVSTTDASCAPTTFAHPASVYVHGMGFSTNGAGDQSETLYADTSDVTPGAAPVRTIRSISLADMTLNVVSLYSPPHNPSDLTGAGTSRAELTGTGDGRLFAFFNDIKPAIMSEFVKGSGALINSVTLNEVPAGGGFAFSFWGGDFWFYTSPQTGHGTVSRYKASGDKSTSVVLNDIGFTIVGAGVSTCAPLVAPVN